MTTIYFVRHGKYVNPNNINPIRLPHFPLSPEGREQVEKDAQYFLRKDIAIIYASPILRTHQSAVILSQKLNKKIIYSKFLFETKSPYIQGMYVSDIRKNVIDLYSDPRHLKRGGETIEKIYKRMNRIVHKVLHQYKGRQVIIVCHGDPIMIYSVIQRNVQFPITQTKLRQHHYIPKGGILKHEYDDNGTFLRFTEVNY